ncbi:MAG TPA: HD domain-containing phosphohydrolase [Polyangia bacterium]|nr:HD domain-containing phosphohydrolase [Polyangia bacterium]
MSTPHVLIADDDVAELLLFRRLLRDTPYVVHTVRSASQALLALGKQDFAAVVADDERLPDMSGAALLAEIEHARPAVLRILLARSERISALLEGAQIRRYQLIARPFFAKPVMTTLIEHAARMMAPDPPPEPSQRIVNPFVQASPDGEAEQRDLPAPARMAHRRILLTLAEVVEAKVGCSPGHGARVGALAGVLAREAGLVGEELEAVEDAALVHDVGELAIDPALMTREGPLNGNEHRQMRNHVESSFQIVRRAGLSPAVLAAVEHHHERWDGGGYLDGLKGEAIPLAARIIAVADTWDALATDRPYRHAVPLADCVRELDATAGNQLDAQLVRLYLDRHLYELIDWSDPPRPGVKLI